VELEHYPDRVLRKKSRPIEEVKGNVMGRARQMAEPMHEAGGVGLSGPQVGWGRRIVTIDVEGAKPEDHVRQPPRRPPRRRSGAGMAQYSTHAKQAQESFDQQQFGPYNVGRPWGCKGRVRR
jgi:hypothetical protein